ncbi:MAG: hypothetical protein M3281_04980 [Chloroflexota bacterium]|nr:hypothetical protein [Chloroflexota bacterium]
MSQARDFSHLVVVGASAGGIEALSSLSLAFRRTSPRPSSLPSNSTRPSQLAEILASRSSLPERSMPDGSPLPLEPGVIFVVPANPHVPADDSQIAVESSAGTRPMPSVDLLLGTAAAVYGEGLIAVILTGTGSDGVEDARAVKSPATRSLPSGDGCNTTC